MFGRANSPLFLSKTKMCWAFSHQKELGGRTFKSLIIFFVWITQSPAIDQASQFQVENGTLSFPNIKTLTLQANSESNSVSLPIWQIQTLLLLCVYVLQLPIKIWLNAGGDLVFLPCYSLNHQRNRIHSCSPGKPHPDSNIRNGAVD